jgi:hypothetical protein
MTVEHEIQRQLLERLGIQWVPGENFYSLVEAEIQLRSMTGYRGNRSIGIPPLDEYWSDEFDKLRDRLSVEMTHCAGWRERALKAEAQLASNFLTSDSESERVRELPEDPDVSGTHEAPAKP